MSVTFYGWDVTFDDDSPRLELQATQEPQDRGVYTMYHGTSVHHARSIISNGFRQSTKGMLGKGVYVSRNKKKAERYPLKSQPTDRVVLELRVRVGRVKRIDKDDHPMQYSWNSHGYDTAWVPPNCGMVAVPSGLEEDCVFDPNRVKVVGIAKASENVLVELTNLLENSLRGSSNMAEACQGAAQSVCSVCNRRQQGVVQHVTQLCWGCGQIICPHMIKHFCRVNM